LGNCQSDRVIWRKRTRERRDGVLFTGTNTPSTINLYQIGVGIVTKTKLAPAMRMQCRRKLDK